MTDNDLADAEEAIGYAFKDRQLLRRALTHSSAGSLNNERLACLGDRIYNVWVARRVFERLADAEKGPLTDGINSLCAGGTQAQIHVAVGLRLFVGGAVMGAGGVATTAMTATALEAMVAAIEIDGGREAAEAFMERALAGRIEEVAKPRRLWDLE